MKASGILLIGCAIASMAWGDCVDGVRAASAAFHLYAAKAEIDSKIQALKKLTPEAQAKHAQVRDKYYAPVVVVISVNDRFDSKVGQSSSRR